ncbi:hypothetical protein [Anaeromicropila populeti]|uniref:Lipoprotein n=1 Tax=Anaeromicropila populeti TaxID=37658 RepID=A0A1I6K4I2_9FIRM|nr:hypothetical protein [Anaeromicropila populeti]SFR86142.1 hypothetical protein SAMN05661086_02187 [Anaeromicropila populeti]
MKRVKLIYMILIVVALLLSSCGIKENVASEEKILNTPYPTEDNNLVTVEPEKELDDSNNKDDIEVSTAPDEEVKESADPYVGVYNDPSIDEPCLKIEKDKDGVYLIKIGLHRVTTLDQCKGVVKDNKLEFSTNEIFDDELKGKITLDGDIAKVVFFGDEWLDFAGYNVIKFEKISDVPYDIS